MRAFALVLLVATSAFAAPSISVTQALINEVGRYPDDGQLFSRAVVNNVWELIDAAGSSVYVNNLQPILEDMANLKDRRAQASATAQVIAILGTIVNGVPGDSCVAASAINSYAAGGSAASFKSIMAQYIDILTQFAGNPLSRRYATSPAAGCAGGGRTYQFEAAWDRILANASPASAGLLNEDYCTLRRMYNTNFVGNNNIAAAATAAAAVAAQGALNNAPALQQFLRALAYDGNFAAAGAEAKRSL